MLDGLKKKIVKWLNVIPAYEKTITVQELLTFNGNAELNNVWYRGDSYELSSVYKQIDEFGLKFWSVVPSVNNDIRKVHTGLPKIMVNTLKNIIVNDMNEVKVDSMQLQEVWNQCEGENQFRRLVGKAINKALVYGDGAFKISIDTNVSEYPIIEFYDGTQIDVFRKRGRIQEITFKSEHGKYTLLEHYGYGYIEYELIDDSEHVVSLDTLDELAELKNVYFDESVIFAQLLYFEESDKWEGRGQSIYDSKRDNFDALDEALSQWYDALRAGRTRTYIPEDLLPRDPKTGKVMKGNSFDNRFIVLNTPSGENANPKVDVQQADIKTDAYLQTYITALDLCLQGVISPSTLGIDNKKLDNAEAQREKEKATLYTRNNIVEALQNVLPLVIEGCLVAYCNLTETEYVEDVDINVSWGEYANPSFEAVVETVGKAKTQQIMSIETCVDELYGDTKDEEWKEQEVARIKNQSGVVGLEEPSMIPTPTLPDEEEVA